MKVDRYTHNVMCDVPRCPRYAEVHDGRGGHRCAGHAHERTRNIGDLTPTGVEPMEGLAWAFLLLFTLFVFMLGVGVGSAI